MSAILRLDVREPSFSRFCEWPASDPTVTPRSQFCEYQLPSFLLKGIETPKAESLKTDHKASLLHIEKPNPNSANKDFPETALHQAALKGSFLAPAFLKSKEDHNNRNLNDLSPMSRALLSSCFDDIKILVESGYDINSFDETNTRPLEMAYKVNNLMAANYLLGKGAAVELISNVFFKNQEFSSSVIFKDQQEKTTITPCVEAVCFFLSAGVDKLKILKILDNRKFFLFKEKLLTSGMIKDFENVEIMLRRLNRAKAMIKNLQRHK
ncbi:MAG: ankyrin repeat domain-containing protein [Parachlamydiaceae bacterium]|nr:ankyrin repeat domain-containing protein [Parachlamydiaceae bacterium]